MRDHIACEAILLGRTVPEETKTGDVSICSAWWQPTLGLIRVYPLPFGGSKLHQWDRCVLQLIKSEKDHRPRSFKLLPDASPVQVGKVDRDSMRPLIEKLADGTTIKALNDSRDSLGVIKPSSVKLIVERGASDATKTFGRNTFDARPRLHYIDANGHHNAGYNEWGAYEFIRKGNDPETLNLKLEYPDRTQFLLVGNLRNRPNSWIVINVLGFQDAQARFAPVAPPPTQRARIFARDGYRCTFIDANGVRCPEKEYLSIDHAIPRSRFGTSNDDENLRTRCLTHNSQKGDRLDHEWQPISYAKAAST